jgi:hypothetical protein
MQRITKHPITKDHLRAFLVKNTILMLLVYYAFFIIALSIVFTTLLYISQSSDLTRLEWFEYAFLSLFNAAPEIDVDLNVFQRLLRGVQAFLSVVLPALLLGAIVFKVLIKSNIIAFRDKCSLYYSERTKAYTLALRFYSTTPLPLTNVYITITRAKVRHRVSGPVRSQQFLSGYTFPLVIQHQPITRKIRLLPEDLDLQNKKLISLSGTKIEDDRIDLIIVVSGQIPAIGIDFSDVHQYVLPRDLQWGKFQNIGMYADFPKTTPSCNWIGWRNYDGIEDEIEKGLAQTNRSEPTQQNSSFPED